VKQQEGQLIRSSRKNLAGLLLISLSETKERTYYALIVKARKAGKEKLQARSFFTKESLTSSLSSHPRSRAGSFSLFRVQTSLTGE